MTLKGNPLRQPYMKVLDVKGELPLLAFLRPDGDNGVLDVEGCGFDALPREVWELPGRTALVNLNLTNNRLRDLPQASGCCRGLCSVQVLQWTCHRECSCSLRC